jgi:pimeloyl-ACP methyl ester carboxylesterase
MLNSQTIKLKDGRLLGYSEYGDPKGKPVFFFHGWPGSRFSGKETDIAARKIGVRVISTDRPGIGLSDFQNNRTLLDWPDDITQLADLLNIKRFSLMGVSGGGPYVASCAYKIPKRILKAGIVVGLAPVDVKGNLDGIPFPAKIGWANYHRFPALQAVAALIAAIEYRYIPIIGKLFSFPTKEDRILYQKSSGGESGVKEAFSQGIRGPNYELKVYTDDWGFMLKDIKVKVYLWYGEKDRCVSINMGKYYQSQIQGSKLFIDPDGGHLSRYNFEEKILKILT